MLELDMFNDVADVVRTPCASRSQASSFLWLCCAELCIRRRRQHFTPQQIDHSTSLRPEREKGYSCQCITVTVPRPTEPTAQSTSCPPSFHPGASISPTSPHHSTRNEGHRQDGDQETRPSACGDLFLHRSVCQSPTIPHHSDAGPPRHGEHRQCLLPRCEPRGRRRFDQYGRSKETSQK